MAVASLLTTLEDMETSPTIVNYGGGQGGGTNTDIFIDGSQSVGRRTDNQTDHGIGVSFTAADLSAAGEHVRAWCFVTQWASVTQLQLRISSGADDDHELPTAEYPDLGGFVPVWVDVSRTPEVGGSANEASISEVGVLLDIGDVGGNAQNNILDKVSHGTSGLRWTGTGGDLDDFRTYENTNREGVLVSLNGVDFCFARVEIGSATATGLTDSGFTLVFPDQALVASTFMGVTVDLQNASTAIDLSNATIQSANPAAATNRPDFLVTGTSGTLDLDAVNLLGLRLTQFTSGCTILAGIIDAQDFTQGGADISGGTVIRPRTAANVAMIDDPTFGTTTDMREATFVQAGSGHALEIDTAGTVTLTDIGFSGFGGTPGSNLVASSGATDAAILNSSGGAVTINVSGGTVPSVRNTAGSTTTVVATVTATFTPVVNGSAFTITQDSDNAVLINVASVTGGKVDYSYDAALDGTACTVHIIKQGEEPVDFPYTLTDATTTVPVAQVTDRVFSNP